MKHITKTKTGEEVCRACPTFSENLEDCPYCDGVKMDV